MYDPEQSSVDLNVSKQLDNISEKKKIRNTQIQAQLEAVNKIRSTNIYRDKDSLLDWRVNKLNVSNQTPDSHFIL